MAEYPMCVCADIYGNDGHPPDCPVRAAFDARDAEIAALREERVAYPLYADMLRAKELEARDLCAERDRLAAENAALTAQVERYREAFVELESGAAQIREHWASFHSVAPSAVAEVQSLMAAIRARAEGPR